MSKNVKIRNNENLTSQIHEKLHQQFNRACYIRVDPHLPAGLSRKLDQYLTRHTANKEAMGWNLISLRAIHGQVAVHEREPFG